MLNSLSDLREQFREMASNLEKVDHQVYLEFGKDPLEPVIGLGDPNSEICIFGRDPGRHEIEFQMPFIGAGGQKVRKEMYFMKYGCEMPDFQASLEVGQTVFWANTVPYKPIGNKAWSEKIKARFKPLMKRVLCELWRGEKIITLGREAFLWFALGEPKSEGSKIINFWNNEERFSKSIKVNILAETGLPREMEIFPLPHPSPLNATWYKAFPGLLRARLTQAGFDKKS